MRVENLESKECGEDRRRFPRYRMECPIQIMQINTPGANMLKNSFCRNISMVGIETLSFDFYGMNENIRLQVYSSEYVKLIQARGRIVWICQLPYQNKYKLGIELTELEPVTEQILKDLIFRAEFNNSVYPEEN